MKPLHHHFSEVVDSVYNLPLEERVALKNLLENNIADERREEMAESFKNARKQEAEGQLHFSSDLKVIKKMLR